MTRIEALWGAARTLERACPWEKGLPPLLFVTDPDRTPDPARIAARLPPGSGVIYRAFGAPRALKTAAALARIAQDRGLVLLIGADEALAAASGAHGLHLPERLIHSTPRLRARHPGWIVTAAAHSPQALARAGEAGCSAALLSAVFASRSPSAGKPLGAVRFASLVRQARLPVYALGGVDGRTSKRLLGSGACGLAAVEGVAEA